MEAERKDGKGKTATDAGVPSDAAPEFLAYEWLDPEERQYRQAGLGDPMPRQADRTAKISDPGSDGGMPPRLRV